MHWHVNKNGQFQYPILLNLHSSRVCTYIYKSTLNFFGARSAFVCYSVSLKNIWRVLVIFYGSFNSKMGFPHYILPIPGTKLLILWEKHIPQLNCFTGLLWIRKKMGFSCFLHNFSPLVLCYQSKTLKLSHISLSVQFRIKTLDCIVHCVLFFVKTFLRKSLTNHRKLPYALGDIFHLLNKTSVFQSKQKKRELEEEEEEEDEEEERRDFSGKWNITVVLRRINVT